MEHPTDLSRDLAPLFGEEPPQRPVGDRLRSGRRALRRRRVGSALGVAAAVGALGTTYVVTSGGSPAADSRLVATTTATPSPRGSASGPKTPEPTVLTKYDEANSAAESDRLRGFHIDYATGHVTAVSGGVVNEVVPMPPEPGEDGAVGVDVTLDGDRLWWYDTWAGVDDEVSSSLSSSDDPQPGTTFADWVQAQQDLQLDNPPPAGEVAPPDLADRFGNYTPPPGATVIRRVDNPLGLAAPYTSTGITLRDDRGTRTMLLFPSSSTTDSGDVSIETLVGRLEKPASSSVVGPMPPLTRTDPTTGMPVVAAGVTVLRRVADPLGVEAPRRSVAYALRYDGRDWWYLYELGPSGYRAAETVRVARDGYPDLESWLADQRSTVAW